MNTTNNKQSPTKKFFKFIKNFFLLVGVPASLITSISKWNDIYTFVSNNFNIIGNSLENKLDITTSPIKIEYLNKKNALKNFYPLFNDQMASNDTPFTIRCATQLFITNYLDQEITINKLTFEAKNIEIDYTPYVNAYLGLNGGITVILSNHGWSDLHNINLKLTSDEYDLSEYFSKTSLDIPIPLLKSGEQQEILLIPDAYIKSPHKNINLKTKLIFNCEENNYQDESVSVPTIIAFLENGEYFTTGVGGDSLFSYGIKLSTNDTNYTRSENISESIRSHEQLVLPICFSADKSCKITCRFTLGYINGNHQDSISTKWITLKLQISSISDFSYDLNELNSGLDTPHYLLSYPYYEATKTSIQ